MNDFYKYFNATGYRTIQSNYSVGTMNEMERSWAEISAMYDEQRNNHRSRRQTFMQNNKVCDEVVFLTEAMIELNYYTNLSNTWNRRKKVFFKEVIDPPSFMHELNDVAAHYFHSNIYANAHFQFISEAYLNIAGADALMDTEVNFPEWAKSVAQTDTVR